MPFKSDQQRKLFFAAMSNPALRKRSGLKKSVIREFIRADKKGKK